MPREAEDLPDEGLQQLQARAVGIETDLRQPLAIELAPVPPMQRLRERVHLHLAETERLADVPHRAARPIGNHGRGERGPLARVFSIDILNDLLAALVL